jgi:hypothetical protein
MPPEMLFALHSERRRPFRSWALPRIWSSQTPALAAGDVSWSNVQRHQAARVSGVVDIGDAHQFDNGVTGADRRFHVVRRDEVSAPR